MMSSPPNGVSETQAVRIHYQLAEVEVITRRSNRSGPRYLLCCASTRASNEREIEQVSGTPGATSRSR